MGPKITLEQKKIALNNLSETLDKGSDKNYEWVKTILYMASGLISIIISLHSAKSTNINIHLLYSMTISLIGLDILSGSIYLYADTYVYQKLYRMQRALIAKSLRDDLPIDKIVSATPNKFFVLMKYVFCASLLCSIPCLIVYAVAIDL